MNLRELEYLVAVAELKHFRKAAERCFVSQPTLSGQLKKLEEELGVMLVERDNRNVRLTSAGEAIAEQARRVLTEARAIRELAEVHSQPMAGKLRVGLIPTIAPYLCPHIMSPLKRAYPQLELLLVEEQTHVLLKRLDEGEMDLAILALLDGMEEEYTANHLYHEAFVLAVPREHPLAGKREAKRSDLDHQKVLMLADGHCLRDQALDVCFSAGAVEDGSFQATSLETLRHMVGAGSGITLMPRLAVEHGHTDLGGPVAYLPFEEPPPTREIVLLHRRRFARQEAAEQLAETIREVMAGKTG
ncbi:DNA-binding transcriptional regulator OxyR [Endothiovibrio diazotrophicus]